MEYMSKKDAPPFPSKIGESYLHDPYRKPHILTAIVE